MLKQLDMLPEAAEEKIDGEIVVNPVVAVCKEARVPKVDKMRGNPLAVYVEAHVAAVDIAVREAALVQGFDSPQQRALKRV